MAWWLPWTPVDPGRAGASHQSAPLYFNTAHPDWGLGAAVLMLTRALGRAGYGVGLWESDPKTTYTTRRSEGHERTG